MNMSATPPIPTLADLAATPGAKRGRYDEIVSIDGIPAREVLDRFRPCLPERFVEFDRAGRGDALNLDLYGHCPAQNVAIVQVRHAFRRARKHRMSLHKDYVLRGFNELTHAPFRHPVSARAVHASIRKDGFDPAAPVCAAQRWMWQVTERQLAVSVRQGDILLVPASRKPAGTTIPDEVHLVGGQPRGPVAAHRRRSHRPGVRVGPRHLAHQGPARRDLRRRAALVLGASGAGRRGLGLVGAPRRLTSRLPAQRQYHE